MRKRVHVSLLASMIGVSLFGGASITAATEFTLAKTSSVSNEAKTYLIEFQELGALNYKGGIAQLRGTAPDPLGFGRFSAASSEVQAYRSYLRQQQADHLASISSVLGHAVEVTHTYEITHSGVAAILTPAEAKSIAGLPSVKSVKADRDYETNTYRGPEFIGAGTIWNAPQPGGAVNRGKGIVVGVLDSGINSTHPSFADDASCGFGPTDKKLISAVDCASSTANVCNGPQAEAVDSGHGVHTASTAAGNSITNAAVPSPGLPLPYTQMSGVAPCAAVRSYKVCPGTTCPGASITAGINNAILDGVDVINFSISGGTSPWSDNDRLFLDAVNADIFVAASAGNTSTTITNPVGQVNHRGPWVMTVAASTQDVNLGAGLSVIAPAPVAPAVENILLNPGSHMTAAVPFASLPIRVSSTNALGCTANGGFPAGTFTGSVALISRGTCAFTEKVANAATAGAQAVIIANNTFGSINMNTDGATIPAYSATQVAGNALSAVITANGATPTLTKLEATIAGAVQADVIGDFSFRGPTPGALADLTKPDITAPGVNIYAAGRVADGNYYLESGTSMSGPHVAGAAALIRAVRPSWTPAEVKSALQMTAKRDGFMEDETTPWNIDIVGSGRADLNKASSAGLVMNETYANYLAANPSGGTISVKDLNIPSVRNMSCNNGSCSFTRTLKSALSTSATWTTGYVGNPALNVTVSPSTFTVAAGQSQTIEITVSHSATLTDIAFGYIELTPSDSGQSPVEHITVAVKGTGMPDLIFKDGFDTDDTAPTMACLSVAGKTSTGEFRSGNAGNSIVTLNIGAGNAMTGAAADASIEALSPSWLNETLVVFAPSSGDGIQLTMSETESSGIELNNSTEGVLLFADYGLDNIVAGADGILHIEWAEDYVDNVQPNARWSTSTAPVTCPGIYITCTDQAACDAAVNAAN